MRTRSKKAATRTRAKAAPVPIHERPVQPVDPSRVVPGGKVCYTAEEVRLQLEFVESHMLGGISVAALTRRCRERFDIGRGRVDKLRARIHAIWQKEQLENSLHSRAAQVKRLMRHIMIASGRRDEPTGKWIEKPDMQAVARLEQLLARIQGNEAPIKIDVDLTVSQNISAVIYNLNAQQVANYLARHQRIVEAAEKYKQLTRQTVTAA